MKENADKKNTACQINFNTQVTGRFLCLVMVHMTTNNLKIQYSKPDILFVKTGMDSHAYWFFRHLHWKECIEINQV